MARTEFGFPRTKCACRSCTINCEYMPGFLIPADVPRIAARLGYTVPEDLGQFAVENLRASTGWKLGVRDQTTGAVVQVISLPTLVPARQPNGHCKFRKEGRCEIHDVSPFGCAFFDNHMDDTTAAARIRPSLEAVADDFAAAGDYTRLGDYLRSRNLCTAGPEVVRPALIAARLKEGLPL